MQDTVECQICCGGGNSKKGLRQNKIRSVGRGKCQVWAQLSLVALSAPSHPLSIHNPRPPTKHPIPITLMSAFHIQTLLSRTKKRGERIKVFDLHQTLVNPHLNPPKNLNDTCLLCWKGINNSNPLFTSETLLTFPRRPKRVIFHPKEKKISPRSNYTRNHYTLRAAATISVTFFT